VNPTHCERSGIDLELARPAGELKLEKHRAGLA